MHRFGSAITRYKRVTNFGAVTKSGAKQFSRSSFGFPKLQSDENGAESVENIYQRWLENPSSVGDAWSSFFRNISRESPSGQLGSYSFTQERGYASGSQTNTKATEEGMAVCDLIRSYQLHGYLLADIDPLGLYGASERLPFVQSEDVTFKHVKDELKRKLKEVKSEINMDQSFPLPPDTFIGGNETSLPLKEIIKRLEDTYCRGIGIEYGHMVSHDQINWIKKKFEPPGAIKLSKDLRRLILARLIRTSGFELFLGKKFPSVKRFSGEGAEMVVPCMKQIIDKSTELGVEVVLVGMAHRGRIGIMANVCRKPFEHILTQFQSLDVKEPDEGDVKYHLGLCEDRLNKVTNKNIRCAMIANPSHLECVGALLQGRARAEQFLRNDKTGKKVLPISIHGDAAVCGQGVCYEIVQSSDVPAFTTYGTIHIIANNQVGFTTPPLDGRSSSFSSALGKINNVPIIHVNGHEPEAVIHVANVAAEWRATFHRDIFLEIVGYRKFGHNENDEPMFTQPIMYTRVHQMKTISDKYSEKLIGEGTVTAKEVEETRQKHEKRCEEAFQKSKQQTYFKPEDWIDSPWPAEFKNQKQELRPTGIPEDVLMHIAKIHASPPPEGFVGCKGLDRVLHGRSELLKNKMLDWSLAEACAFGSLLKEGVHVRITGQDLQRGTFSHRHYVLHHQTVDNSVYIPLSQVAPNQGVFSPVNSLLSEYAVLGFEFGYSQTNPNILSIWEAQFGDFQNTAQCMIDCFIANSEHKWRKQSSLVMNLPHGLEGMGADHSSARPERFLHMCLDDARHIPTATDGGLTQLRECNWIVAHVTTPANLFHIYRRQMYLPFRKPLISFYPKSLLRLPAARSPVDDFKEGTTFLRVIPDSGDPAGVKKVVFSCGKVFYDFFRARHAKKLQSEIALIRIEQVYPFPYDLLSAEITKYPNAKFCFGQEEHCNHGYHTFVIPRLQNLLPGKEIKLIARPPGAASAAGFPKTHQRQLNKLLLEFINA